MKIDVYERTMDFIKILIILCFIMCLSLFQGCGVNSGNVFDSKTSVQSMFDIYNSQYADYMYKTGYEKDTNDEWVKINDPVLSEEQKDILRSKKKILTEVYPLIQAYDSLVQSGGKIDPELETKITRLLDHLIMTAL